MAALRFAAFVLFSCLAIATEAQTTMTAKTVWAKCRTIGQKVPLQANLTVTIWSEQGTTETRAKFVRDSDGHHRREYQMPLNALGRIVIHDGTTRWQYEPTRKLLLKSPFLIEEFSAEENAENFDLKEYRLSLEPKLETLSGRTCYVLKIVPKHVNLGSQTRWVDNRTFCTLQSETRYSNGALISRVVYSNVQFPASIAPSTFALPKADKVKNLKQSPVPPRQTDVEMAKFATAQGLQTKLPMGFRLRRVLQQGTGKSSPLQFLYSDGLFSLSVFVAGGYSSPASIPPPWKSVRIGNLTIHEQTRSNTHVMVWMKQGRRYSVMSRVSPKALREFVRGILL